MLVVRATGGAWSEQGLGSRGEGSTFKSWHFLPRYVTMGRSFHFLSPDSSSAKWLTSLLTGVGRPRSWDTCKVLPQCLGHNRCSVSTCFFLISVAPCLGTCCGAVPVNAQGACARDLTSSGACNARESWELHLRQQEAGLGDEWSVT